MMLVIYCVLVTIIAFYQTDFPRDSFLPSELPIFALIGYGLIIS